VVIPLRLVPQIAPFKTLASFGAVFGQQFGGSAQVAGNDRLVGEIDVGNVLVKLRFLLVLQSALSLPFRVPP